MTVRTPEALRVIAEGADRYTPIERELAAELLALRAELSLARDQLAGNAGTIEALREIVEMHKTVIVQLRADLDAVGEQDITINQLQHELTCVRKVCDEARARCYPHGRADVPQWVTDIEQALGNTPP